MCTILVVTQLALPGALGKDAPGAETREIVDRLAVDLDEGAVVAFDIEHPSQRLGLSQGRDNRVSPETRDRVTLRRRSIAAIAYD